MPNLHCTTLLRPTPRQRVNGFQRRHDIGANATYLLTSLPANLRFPVPIYLSHARINVFCLHCGSVIIVHSKRRR